VKSEDRAQSVAASAESSTNRPSDRRFGPVPPVRCCRPSLTQCHVAKSHKVCWFGPDVRQRTSPHIPRVAECGAGRDFLPTRKGFAVEAALSSGSQVRSCGDRERMPLLAGNFICDQQPYSYRSNTLIVGASKASRETEVGRRRLGNLQAGRVGPHIK
jgi:hypothetical protein